MSEVVCILTCSTNTFGCYCPGAAAEPVLVAKGEAGRQELICVSSQCGRLGTAGGCAALHLQLCSSFSSANSILYSPARLSRFTLRAADFLLFLSLSFSRNREGFLPDSASLMDAVSLFPSMCCSPQSMTDAQAFECDPGFSLYSPG